MSSDNDAPPTISYTSKRTTTKTRTAATSARRRKNIPICHASGSGDNPDGKDQHSWFARKSVGWTDEEIKNHVVSGGVSNGGKSFSMVGDVILGASSTPKKDKKKKKMRRTKRFAWEEDDEEEDDGSGGRMMTAADIMDEQDEVDFMAPVKVSQSYQMKKYAAVDSTDNNRQDDNAKSANNGSKSRRRQNAALDELAQVCGDTAGSNGRIQPTSANESIGWRLLRVLGYRIRLGMAFVPLAGHVGGGLDSIDNDVVKELGNGKQEAKWLASKRLRAIRLPSIQNVDDTKKSTDAKEDKKKSKVLTIPPPKINRHGIGFDPFKNAPEFRKFHERRQELAKKQGRATEDDTAKGNRYSTDNLKDGRQALWDKGRSDIGKDSEDEMSDPGAVKSHQQPNSHYAADRDYTDFIGTKASSGFALHDEDDANVYQDEEGRGDNGDEGEYTTEIHSPVASEDEDDNGLFGKSAIIEKKSKASEKGMKGVEDKGKIAADAWSAWGIGESPAVKRTAMDGKPPLSGFILAASTDSQTKSDAPKRWKGPTVPSGYVLNHHVFTKEEDCDIKESVVDGMDSGLGLDLQHRQQQQPSRASIPKVLPPSRMQPPLPDGKMLSRGGNEVNFHAVKESMKNRFTSAETTTTTTTFVESEVNDDNNNKQDMDKEEWVTVEVSTWLPTRLLCKRWGVTAPSTGVSEKGGMVQSKEENYFRQTIMAEHPDVGSSNTKTPATSSSKTKAADNGMQVDNFLGDEDSPPPERPSDAVFQLIFNAESDMDISSDDDNESDEDDLNTTRANDETDTKKESAASVDRSHLPQTNGSLADIKPQPADHSNDNALLPADDSTDSDSSDNSKHRRKRRKKSDERHRRSESDEEYNDRRKRKKKKHKNKRSKHKKSRY